MNPCLIGVVVALSITSIAGAQGSERFNRFMSNWTTAEKMREAGDFAAAAQSYRRVLDYAEFEPSSRFLLARCLARLGDTEPAFMELTKAVEYGWNDADAIARGEPDLESLRGDPRLAKLAAAAKACANETVILHRGRGTEPDARVPLVVVLHGLGDAPRGSFAYWREVADKLGLVIVAPYGATKLGAGMAYGWHREGGKGHDLDLPAARSAIQRAIEHATAATPVDEQRMILAGFSQGAALSLRMLADQPERFLGAIAFCPISAKLDADRWRQATNHRRLKAYFMIGGRDRWSDAGHEALIAVQEGGVTVQSAVFDDMGHEMPIDYVMQQTKALTFILRTE